MNTMKRLLGLVAPLLLSAACSPSLRGASNAPPGLTLRHDASAFDDDTVTLSKGAAYALDCYDPWEGTCNAVVAKSENPKIAAILTSHMERTTDWYGERRAIPARPGFVITGAEKGETYVTVTGKGGQSRIHVIVE